MQYPDSDHTRRQRSIYGKYEISVNKQHVKTMLCRRVGREGKTLQLTTEYVYACDRASSS